MKKEIADQWVAALRSGEYKQSAHGLRPALDTFCCLGVLCNLHALAHPEIAAAQTSHAQYMGAHSFLPATVRDWAGLLMSNPRVSTYNGNVSLSHLNDQGAGFNKIADLIEKNWSRM